MPGPGLGGGSQGQWGQEEQERRELGESEEEGSYGPGCDCRQGMGMNWHVWRGGAGEHSWSVGQVRASGSVWGRWNERRGAGEHPWGGDRFRVTRDESQALWGSPSTVRAAWGSPEQAQPRGSPIARVVSAVFNPNKRCHRHQETPVSLRVSVPPTGLGFGNRQCPLQAAAAGRDDHPVLPATPPARLSPRPLPGPGLGPVARGEFDRTVGAASGEAGRERERRRSAAAGSSRAQRLWRTVARGDGRGAMEPGVGGGGAEGEAVVWAPHSAPRKPGAWRAGTLDRDAGARSERDGAGGSEASGWARRGGRCPVPGGLGERVGGPVLSPGAVPRRGPPHPLT